MQIINWKNMKKIGKLKLNDLTDSMLGVEDLKHIWGGATYWDPISKSYVLDEVVVTAPPIHTGNIYTCPICSLKGAGDLDHKDGSAGYTLGVTLYCTIKHYYP